MKESRLDRIEKDLHEFLQGMKEERAAIAELREAQNRSYQETLELRASIAELREAQKKTDEQLQRTDEQLVKTVKKLDDIGEKLGEMGIIQGKVAEELFYRNVKNIFLQKNMALENVRRNVKKKGIAEYDIVATDNGRVLIIEVRNTMERHMIDEFPDRKIPKFKQVFPEYRDFHLIGGIGALVMQDAVGRYAEKKGLYVMTQSGDGKAMLINRQDFTAKEFF